MKTFHIIRWLDTPANKTMKPNMTSPRLGIREERYNNDAFSNSGGGWHLWPENAEVLEVLELPNWEAAELHYLRKYFPVKPSKLRLSGGWIAPTGDFYPCGFEGHDRLADRITACLWHSLDGQSTLEKYGWARLESNGSVQCGSTRGKPTAAQRVVFAQLAGLDGAEEMWQDRLRLAAEED